MLLSSIRNTFQLVIMFLYFKGRRFVHCINIIQGIIHLKLKLVIM